jgi:hydrogenase nickel incorporation protein HypA/HybF
MHEMSICLSVVEALKEQAKVHSYSRVKAVWLEIGPLSGVEPESLLFCFDAVAQGTLAEGAKLEIVQTPVVAWCMTCSKNVNLESRFDGCPECGGRQLQITGGNELRIKSLEVD